MDINQILGIVLVATGLVDVVIARMVLEPRLKDKPERRLVVNAVMGSGAAMALAGSMFLAGWIALPR